VTVQPPEHELVPVTVSGWPFSTPDEDSSEKTCLVGFQVRELTFHNA
jgi:hypothetical protein